MINILIVEDERIEREAIAKMIGEQLKDRIGLVISADNGEQALEVFEQQNIGLIISDVNIPKINGLQFLREVKKRSPSVKCMVLTGYDYFEYAQDAIRIGVDDFVLKPASQKDLCERIRKIIDQMEHDEDGYDISKRFREIQSILESDLIYAVLYNDSPKHILQFLSIFHMRVNSAVCFCMYHYDVDMELLQEAITQLNEPGRYCLFETYFEFVVLFVFSDAVLSMRSVQMIQQTLQTLSEQEPIKVGVGEVKTEIKDYYNSFLDAMNYLKKAEQEEVQIADTKKQEINQQQLVNGFVEEIMTGIQTNRLTISSEIADKLYEATLKSDRQSILEMLYVFFDELSVALTVIAQSERSCAVLQHHKDHLEYLERMQDIRVYVTYVLKSVIDPLIHAKRKRMNKLIISAYDYIADNYCHPIGLNDLAEYLKVTPQYISSLLSSHTQNNFTNILAEYRIEKAKELLLSNKKIKEIASLVGFQNQNYFAKTFKKVTGMTPKEFKNESNH